MYTTNKLVYIDLLGTRYSQTEKDIENISEQIKTLALKSEVELIG